MFSPPVKGEGGRIGTGGDGHFRTDVVDVPVGTGEKGISDHGDGRMTLDPSMDGRTDL